MASLAVDQFPADFAFQLSDIAKLVETVQLHDGRINAIARVLRQMVEKPPDA